MTQRRPSSSEQGAAMIEFAICAVVLVTLVFGVIGVSMAFYTYEVVNEYARDASRYAIVHGNGCSIPPAYTTSCSIGGGDTTGPPATRGPADAALKTYLNNEIFPGINGTSLNLSTVYGTSPGEASCFATSCNGAGDQVTVTVSYPYLYAIPFIPKRNFTMSASSTMVISQ